MTTPGARQSRVEKLASAKGPALLVVFLALVGLAVGVSIQRDYAQTIADAFQTLESQAILAEAKVSGVLRGLDIGLHGLAADERVAAGCGPVGLTAGEIIDSTRVAGSPRVRAWA